MAEQSFRNLATTPVRFELPFDPARVDSRARHQVTARIEANGAVRFASTRVHPVSLSRGVPPRVDIVVEPVL